MTISAKVICDSFCSSVGRRITTMELEYPRFIHAEFMTHRKFTRNASSSRAIPVKKTIEAVNSNPAMPIHWGKNQSGMQAREELDDSAKESVERLWLDAKDCAVQLAKEMNDLGAHKQIVNRILEPFSHIRVLVTATEFANFFALRNHKDAQPEICELAKVMREAMDNSMPTKLDVGEWHLPYIDATDHENIYTHLKRQNMLRREPSEQDRQIMACAISAARCARVSYLTHDGERPSIEKDLELYYHLVNANPPHMSPCEHQATPDVWIKEKREWEHADQHGNFYSWIQFRHLIKDEYVPG